VSGPPDTDVRDQYPDDGGDLIKGRRLKYGARSVPEGQTGISWQAEASDAAEAKLRMQWTESGGPPVKPPARKGFDSRLIETALAAEFGGAVTVDYASDGGVFNIRAPLAAIQKDESSSA